MTVETPTFIYAMSPLERSSFDTFFEAGSVTEILRNPGQLRPSGWDLTTSDNPRLVKGEYWEVKQADRKLIRVYQDGSLLVRVAADNTYLAWGRNLVHFRQQPRLNSVAMTEFSYNFVLLCGRVLQLMHPIPNSVSLFIGIKNAFLDKEVPLYVTPYPTHTNGWQFDQEQFPAQDHSMERSFSVQSQELISRPGLSAYLLLKAIYTWFGVTADRIPYVRTHENERFVDPADLLNLKP
jgi:hypothetical protein